jgi:hypothetical protein
MLVLTPRPTPPPYEGGTRLTARRTLFALGGGLGKSPEWCMM